MFCHDSRESPRACTVVYTGICLADAHVRCLHSTVRAKNWREKPPGTKVCFPARRNVI